MLMAMAMKFNQPPDTPATYVLFDKDLGAGRVLTGLMKRNAPDAQATAVGAQTAQPVLV